MAACSPAPSAAQKDLSTLCAIAADPSVNDQGVDPAVRAMIFAGRVEKELTSAEVKTGLSAIAGVDPSQKYPLIERMAQEELKVKDWQCPALQKLWTPAETTP